MYHRLVWLSESLKISYLMITQLATVDELAYHVPSPSNISFNSDSTSANPTDHPSNSSSHTMAIHPEINETDEKNDTHINVITSLTTGSQSDVVVSLTLALIATSLRTTPD